jgi:hypothetical protein
VTDRREFPKAVKVEIIKRATRDGVIYCECCGLPTKRFNIDHIKPDGMELDKKRKLTAADGQLLCSGSRGTCHGRKTAEEDIPAIARAKSVEAAHLGARTRPVIPIKSAPFAKSERTAKRQPRPKVEGPTAIERRFQRV